MNSDVVIRAEGLGKKYVIGHQSNERYTALRDVMAQAARNLVRTTRDMLRGQALVGGDETEEFWALKEIDFEIKRGEVVGIIGRNGAGKSTLLKVLSRITEPSEGRVTINGRVASLLEVGTGFHPELSGRENIYLNGAILGMNRAEINRKFDEIVDFCSVEKFLDTPVKRYSSGMYVRLAFAVAAHLEPEILIVDEVLAVGDAEFQKKCLGKMKDVSGQGRTVLFVSHNMQAVQTLCSRSVLLDKGSLKFSGATSLTIDAYQKLGTGDNTRIWERKSETPNDLPAFDLIEIDVTGQQPNLQMRVKALITVPLSSPLAIIAVDIYDSLGSPLMQAVPSVNPFLGGTVGHHTVKIDIRLPPLIPGTYSVGLWLGPHNAETFDTISEAAFFEISETPTLGRTFPHTFDHGFIVPESHLVAS